MNEHLVAALSALLSSLLAALVLYFVRRRATLERERLAGELAQLAKERWDSGVAQGPATLRQAVAAGERAAPDSTPELLQRMEEQILSRIAASSRLTEGQVLREVDQQLALLQDRLLMVESRFPDRARLERTASLHDALLSERTDQLAKQVEALQQRVLSKWDVAMTVSTIIAGIAFVVGATYTILRLLKVAP